MKQLTPAVQQAPATQYWNDSVVEAVVVEDDGAEFTRESSIFCGSCCMGPASGEGSGARCRIRPNIWAKMVLFVSLLVLTTTGGMALVVWTSAQRALNGQIMQELNNTSILKQVQILNYLNDMEGRLAQAASRIGVRAPIYDQYLLETNQSTMIPSYTHSTADLNALLAYTSYFLAIGAYDRSGKLLFASNVSANANSSIDTSSANFTPPFSSVAITPGVPIYTSPLYLSPQLVADVDASKSIYVTPPTIDLTTKMHTINLSAAMISESVFFGILAATISFEAFYSLVQDGSGLRRTGRVLVGYPAPNNSAINFVVPPASEPTRTQTPFEGPLSYAILGQHGFERGPGNVIATYRPVGFADWGMVAEMDSSEAYAVVRHMQLVMILSVAVTLLIGLAASTLIALFLVFPIRDLSRATAALAEGKRDARAKTRTRQRWWDDEIGDLRLAFNRMAEQLMVNHETLENKVEERTRDLNRANSGLELEIRERTKVEGELKVAKDAAVAADVAKSEFLANMSHEIRTPLNGIISGTELCLDTDVSEVQEEYLQLSLYSGKHLLRLITDILDFSKIEAGKLELEHIPFSIADQLEAAAAVVATRAHGKGLELVCSADPTLPRTMVGDPSRLFQILVNLMGNSIKFTACGEVVVEARLKSRAEKGEGEEGAVEVVVSVRDTGIGIPLDKQRLLFHKFQQVDASTSRLHGGTGLGLVISARLAEAMGGTMWVESEAGRGADFRFTAKFGVFDTNPEPVVEVGEGVRVLVVVHSLALARTLREVLGGWGMGCTCVKDKQEALRALREAKLRGRPFHLILVDMWRYLPLPTQGQKESQMAEPPVDSKAEESELLQTPPGSTAGNAVPISMPPGSPLPDKNKEHAGVPPGFQRVVTFDLLEGLASEPRLLARLGSGAAGSGNWGSGRNWGGEGSVSGSSEGGGGEEMGLHVDTRHPLPVVFLTTALHTDVAICKAEGVPFYVAKPLKRSALQRCICRALSLPQLCGSATPSSSTRTQAPRPTHSPSATSSSSSPARPCPPSPPPPSPHTRKNLVVDDNLVNQKVATALLKKWGHTCTVAGNGQLAFEAVQMENFDGILMDIQMPVCDGHEATRRIRRWEKEVGKHTPIFAITANVGIDEKVLCMESGMDGYLTKPFDIPKLKEHLLTLTKN